MRPANTEWSVGVQHEVAPRVGVTADFFQRSFSNFTVTDNRSVTAADYTNSRSRRRPTRACRAAVATPSAASTI